MNRRLLPFLSFTLLVAALLACQMTKSAAGDEPVSTRDPATLVPSTTATSMPEEAEPPAIQGPDATVTAYLEALQQRRFEQAAAFISDYSLSLLGLRRQDIISHFEQQDFEGWRLLDYRVTESQELDEDLVLVHALIKEQIGRDEPQNYDVWWALRREGGEWRINWGALVDDRPLDIEPQTINDLTLQPLRIIRYADRMRLLFRIENNSDRGCIWGWAGEEAAAIHFGDQIVSVSGTSEDIAPQRVYPDAYVDIDGFRETYPTAVDLTGWRQADERHPQVPDGWGDSWAYHFELSYDEASE